MPERITKLQRWIDLIACLVGRRLPITFEELVRLVPSYAQGWDDADSTKKASVRRMFERDKDELRASGIPLQTVRYSINYGHEEIDGYRIARRDFYLPYLKLVEEATREGLDPGVPERRVAASGRVQAQGDPLAIPYVDVTQDEARLALEALRRVAEMPAFPLLGEARSAFRKLAFDLDPDAFSEGAPVLFVERPETGELLERLRHLSDALLARKRIRFRYHGIYRGETTEREVEAFGLLFQHGHWYVIGHDIERNGRRVFRAERMDGVTVNARTPNTPDYEVPNEFRLDDYANREAWELGADDEDAVVAHVLFRWPASLAAERNRQGVPIETREDGSAVRSFDVHQVHPFLRWMLSLEGDAVILEPPELVSAFRELARDVAHAHGAGVEDGVDDLAAGDRANTGEPSSDANDAGGDIPDRGVDA
jgi:proteasome accessory factor B